MLCKVNDGPDLYPLTNLAAFFLNKCRDRISEPTVSDPVSRPCGDRQESSANLVFALGPGFETGKPSFYTEFNALIITGFKVQSWNLSVQPQ